MIQIEHDSKPPSYQRQATAWWRKSVMVSAVGHTLLVLFLITDLAALFFIFLGLSSPPPGKRVPIVLEVTAEEEQAEQPVPEMLVAVEPYDKKEAFAAAEAVAGRMDFEDPALQQPLDYDYQPSETEDSPTTDMRKFVQENVSEAIAQSNQQDSEENQNKLEELAQRLERNSSAESIEGVTGMLGNLLGTNERASRPAEEPVAGMFDFDTGQLHDVLRKERDPQGYAYFVILVDAEGRQMEVEIPRSEGKQAYDAFEKIKRYPFLDKIYRSVVMSVIDGVIPK